jgi:O-methyltransferase
MNAPPLDRVARPITDRGAELYLDLLKACLTRYLFDGSPAFDAEIRAEGRDWPKEAETMIGLRRLDNLHRCITAVLTRGVEGDFIETGVWRGGATIFMRGALKAYGDSSRVVWVADSFAGLPEPDPERFPADSDDQHWTYDELAVSLPEVQRNFARYGLLDEQVRFLEGWFRDTLPAAPIERLAILRLDGDMYESTWVALESLYDRVSHGGFVIVDDYGAVGSCRAAVDDFRARRGIDEPLQEIDWTGVFWERLR